MRNNGQLVMFLGPDGLGKNMKEGFKQYEKLIKDIKWE